MHDMSATNVPALVHQTNGKMSSNFGSFPDHDNAESGGSSHVDIIKDAATKHIPEDNNVSDTVSCERNQLM